MDIKQALESLVSSGMTDAEIGEAVKAPQSIITRLRNGTHKSTSYERGKKIFDLAKRQEKAVSTTDRRTNTRRSSN